MWGVLVPAVQMEQTTLFVYSIMVSAWLFTSYLMMSFLMDCVGDCGGGGQSSRNAGLVG